MESKLLTIKAGLASKHTIAFSADCEISYVGRAETTLGRGERLVIVKQDGTVLVHQPDGNHPVNYMKAGTECTLEFSSPSWILRCAHIADGDEMLITMFNIHFAETVKLNDGQKVQLTGNERDMSDMIYANPSLIEPGLSPVSKEEQTKYGFIDVLCYDKDNALVIVECKRFKADLSAVTQLRRYVEKIKESKGIDKVRGIVAAPSITENAKLMLKDWGFSFVSIEPPKFRERLRKEQSRLSDF